MGACVSDRTIFFFGGPMDGKTLKGEGIVDIFIHENDSPIVGDGPRHRYTPSGELLGCVFYQYVGREE